MSYYSDMTIDDMGEEIKDLEEKLRVAVECLEFISEQYEDGGEFDHRMYVNEALELITKEI